jgi:hypothetical protein
MVFELVWEGWIECESNGNRKAYDLPRRSGGRNAKVVHYDVVVVQSSGANVRLSLDLKHGPDGVAKTTHSTVFASQAPGVSYPALVAGDADASRILSEWLHPVLSIASTAATLERALIKVYELRKPF